jgi:hypothetical protein
MFATQVSDPDDGVNSMSKDLLLIGSVPLDSVEQVIRTFGCKLGPYLQSMPDGEVGDRRWWVIRLHYQVFNGHPEIETVRRPAPDDGVERLVPRNRDDMWKFRVKPGTENVRFGDLGWRLGFARDAATSYFIFKKLRDEGILPDDVRFQVSLPLVNSVITPGLFPPEDLPKVRPGYEAALGAEIKKIAEIIPAKDLALQWDCSWEITDVYNGIPGVPANGAIERNIGQIARLSPLVPSEALLGFHFCFGTFGGWPRFEPPDLARAVELANASIKTAGRRVDWLHIPMLNRSDKSYYQPLSGLSASGTRVYLGLIHSMETFAARFAAARDFLPDFGLAAYCGFGREAPASMPAIIERHLEALRIARGR